MEKLIAKAERAASIVYESILMMKPENDLVFASKVNVVIKRKTLITEMVISAELLKTAE